MRATALVLLLTGLVCGAASDGFQHVFGHIVPQASTETQQQAVLHLIQRLLPSKAHLFNITVDPSAGPAGKDTFQVVKHDGSTTITIKATSGVGAALGFHHYLKYSCSCHVSWDGDQLAVPDPLPSANYTITTPDRFRYYQNVCTPSYSFVWWDWARWEREIDWMALNGINLPLAFSAQEALWQRVYTKLGLSEEEIAEHFSGPAFLAWNRMGNMRGWGGPLPASWHERALKLQHQILTRMREFGMTPVLPAFAGHVPRAFNRLFPGTNLTQMAPWNYFGDQYCCPYLLDPTSALFREVGNLFVTEVIKEFGTDHMYNCDTFNEMPLPSGNISYVASVSEAIFQAITDVDPHAVWVKQNWAFVNNGVFWTKERARAFLTAVPLGRMLVLDLKSEQLEQYTRLDSYFGQPFIWCMLHNFGGTLGLYGMVDNVNRGVFEGRHLENGTMVGVGLTPEGINQNYVMYDLMLEMGWRNDSISNLSDWFTSYARRRYGAENSNAEEAWRILKRTVYNFTDSEIVYGQYVITQRPGLKLESWTWYTLRDLLAAWDNLLLAAHTFSNSPTYLHDLVDVTRQVIQTLNEGYYFLMVDAFQQKNIEHFNGNATMFLDGLADLQILLSSNKDFLLGSWLQAAKSCATTPEEERLYEINARNQITLWGPNGEIVDYATKQWAGVVSHYYQPRWKLFIAALNYSLTHHTAFNEGFVQNQIFEVVERPFTFNTSVFPSVPQGNSIAIVRNTFGKWKKQLQILNQQRHHHHRWRPYFFHKCLLYQSDNLITDC